MTSLPHAQIAVFIDYENMAISAKNQRLEFSLDPVLEALRVRGRPVLVRAFGDWATLDRYPRDLRDNAVEMVQLYRYGTQWKNRADIALAVQAMDALYRLPHIDVFVIVSGDGDYSPLAGKLREMGKRVIGVGVRGATSPLLVSSCDEFLYYDTLVASTTQSLEPLDLLDLVEKALRVLQQQGESSVTAERLRQVMSGLDPAFTAAAAIQHYGSFDAFLQAYPERVQSHVEDGITRYRLPDAESAGPGAGLDAPPVAEPSSSNPAVHTTGAPAPQAGAAPVNGHAPAAAPVPAAAAASAELRSIIGERAYALLGRQIEEPPPAATTISAGEARRTFDQGQTRRRVDFAGAAHAMLLAARIQWRALQDALPGADRDDLRWYVASTLSAEAGARYIRREYQQAIPFYLGYFSMLRPNYRIWEDVRGLTLPMLGYYFLLATRLEWERDAGRLNPAQPGEIIVLTASHPNDRVVWRWYELARDLAEASPYLVEEIVALIEEASAPPDTIRQVSQKMRELADAAIGRAS